jgi:hypothetical protein
MTPVWTWIALALTTLTWIIPFVMLFIVPANRKPSSATAELNLEVTLLCYDPRVVADLRRAEAGYAARSRELTLDEWRRRPLHKRLFENLTRLMSPLL